MTRTQQRAFIRELIGNVRADLLKRSAEVPAEWDGHELRRWIADRFRAANCGLLSETNYSINGRPSVDRRRIREYENTVLTRGL